jgi:hypothetical protein
MEYVVHCKVKRYDVYIGRGSMWGNPFKIGKDGNRQEVIDKFERFIRSNPAMMLAAKSLKGKVLGCWCKPAVCHGDILAKIANEENE